MPWPLGQPRAESTKLKLRQAHTKRCSDPEVKAVWRETQAAQRFWYVHSKPWLKKAAKEAVIG